MHKWYNSPECDALRAAWGAYPASPETLESWPGFVAVTNAFLDHAGPPPIAPGHRSPGCLARPGLCGHAGFQLATMNDQSASIECFWPEATLIEEYTHLLGFIIDRLIFLFFEKVNILRQLNSPNFLKFSEI